MAGSISACRLASAAAALAAAMSLAGAAAAGPKVFSLDQCADQYVLALAPRADVVGLSWRARDGDSYMRAAARGLPRHRASLESVLASRPQIVVREWGGARLMFRRLAHWGVRVVEIDDATDYAGVRANVRRVAAALGRPAAGEALIARMDAQLKAAHGAWRGRRALYLTPGGFTAGPGTLVGATLAAAGLTDAASGPGFSPTPLERLVLRPPEAAVLGFFDRASVRAQHWSQARSGVLISLIRGRTIASLPGSILGCPAWFAADGAVAIGGAAGDRRP